MEKYALHNKGVSVKSFANYIGDALRDLVAFVQF